MSVLDGPGEGTWSVFAQKVVEERDELRHKLAGEAAHIKSLEDLLVDAVRERDALRAEIEVLRGVGCREAKAGEPESGPCGVCLRCAEERGERRAQAEVERLRRLLDHATQSNPGTSVLVMLMDEAAKLRERIASMQESMSMACEEPRTGCECAGCSYAREKGGDA